MLDASQYYPILPNTTKCTIKNLIEKYLTDYTIKITRNPFPSVNSSGVELPGYNLAVLEHT
jgi:hypothetical protein